MTANPGIRVTSRAVRLSFLISVVVRVVVCAVRLS